MRIEAPDITTCETCDGVHMDTRKRSPSQWLCVHFKRVKGGSFVAPQAWVEQEPFLKCQSVNGGACPFWMPRRDASQQEVAS